MKKLQFKVGDWVVGDSFAKQHWPKDKWTYIPWKVERVGDPYKSCAYGKGETINFDYLVLVPKYKLWEEFYAKL